jgi:hypothetical protein
MKLTGHGTEGEHRKCTHHEMDNRRAAVEPPPRSLADFRLFDTGKCL